MSFVEIYSFDTSGIAHLYGEVRNSWLDAMNIWRIMERRYLPPYRPADLLKKWWYRPGMTDDQILKMNGSLPTRVFPSIFPSDSDTDLIDQIWALAEDKNIPFQDRIVLATTFDTYLVRKDEIQWVIEAMEEFKHDDDGWETNLAEQVEVLKKLENDPEVIAVGWNQTSVRSESWDVAGEYDESTKCNAPYNCLTGNKHCWLFDELAET